MFWPGVAAIWGALFAGTASAVTYWRVDRGRRDLLGFARTTYAAFTACIVASAAILMTLILQHRFDVSYVNSYSSLELPLHFLPLAVREPVEPGGETGGGRAALPVGGRDQQVTLDLVEERPGVQGVFFHGCHGAVNSRSRAGTSG